MNCRPILGLLQCDEKQRSMQVIGSPGFHNNIALFFNRQLCNVFAQTKRWALFYIMNSYYFFTFLNYRQIIVTRTDGDGVSSQTIIYITVFADGWRHYIIYGKH